MADSASSAAVVHLQSLCAPGLLAHMLFPAARREARLARELVEFAAASGFYRAVELAEVSDGAARARIRACVEANGLKLVYWLSLLQMESRLNLAALDEDERRAAVRTLAARLPEAAEMGAHTVALISAPDVAPALRPRASAALLRSCVELAEAARPLGLTRFALETMDRGAHKNNLLGPTSEALDFLRRLRAEVPQFYLAFDTSHIRLLEEDPLASVGLAAPFIGQLHLANCVAQRGQPGYGDHHMPPGAPGFLTPAWLLDFLRRGCEVGVLGEARPVLSLEVAGPGGDASWVLEAAGRALLTRVAAVLSAEAAAGSTTAGGA